MSLAALPIAARRHHVVTALARGLETACGTRDLGPVVLGISGGVDSTAMLLATSVLVERPEWQIQLIPVHVNHNLREDSDLDAMQASECCKDLGLACQVVDAWPKGGGEEARVHRYEALMSVAATGEASWILAAHHAEDQLETIIAALGRGAGPTGLSGMAQRRPLGDGVALVRPLLDVTKSDLESLCQAAEVTWREDPTNHEPTTLRGRLRRDVLPVLEELWPGAAQRSAVNAPLVREAAEALLREAAEVFGSETTWPRQALRAVNTAIRSTGLRQALMASGLGADEIDTTRLVEASEAIADRSEHARSFEFNTSTAIAIDANRVWITTGTNDD